MFTALSDLKLEAHRIQNTQTRLKGLAIAGPQKLDKR
jgi:hypothetical protein